MRHLFPATLFIALLVAPAYANDATTIRVGDAYPIVPNDKIALVTERLAITLTDDGFAVEVISTYHNDGPATQVTMAFPEEAYNTGGIENFQSWVDDQPVSVQFAYQPDYEGDDEWDRLGKWIKEVSFAADQIRTVKVTYHAPYGGSAYGSTGAGYTLTTGASWAGSIASFECTLDFSQLTRHSRPEARGYRGTFPTYGHYEGEETLTLPWKPAGDRVWVWRADDFEPDFDLAITLVEGFWHFTLDGDPFPVFDLYGTNDTFHGYYSHLLREDDEILVRVDEWMCMLPILPTLYCNSGSEEDSCSEGEELWYSVRVNGNALELCASGLFYPLARGAVPRPDTYRGEPEETWDYLYLRDLVAALGGTYHYDPIEERADLTFPPE